MPQQINLYNPELRRRREWLSLSSVALVSLLLAGALVAGGFGLRLQTQALRVESQALDARLAEEGARVRQAAAVPGNARQELARVQQQLGERRSVLAALQAGPGGGLQSGFADYLRGLARQSAPGLWLTGFAVGQGGEGMEIRGRMTEAGALPEYIRRLNSERSFLGRQFVSLHVEQPHVSGEANPAPAGFNSFVLTSVPAADVGKEKGAAR